MYRLLTGALALLVCAPALLGLDTPAEEYKAILAEYKQAQDAYRVAAKDAKTNEERQKVFEEKYPKPEKFAERFLQLAEKNPKDPAAVDALVWVVNNSNTAILPLGGTKPDAPPAGKSPRERALELLLRDHITSDKLAPFAERLGNGSDKEGEKNLRLLIEKNPSRDVQGTAYLSLARRLKSEAQNVRRLAGDEKMRERMEKSLGKERVQEMLALDPAKLDKEVEQLFERVVKEYADVKSARGTLGKTADSELFEIRHLSIGKAAPDIEADDLDGKPFKLSEYRGKVVMIDFWGHW